MATVLTRPTNGVSYGYLHTVTGSDDSQGYVIIDFQVDYMLAAAIMVLDGVDERTRIEVNDLVITYPANGQVKIADGAIEKVVTGRDIHIIANKASTDQTV